MKTEHLNEQSRLQELGHSDFEIAEGQPDIRGWSLTDDQGTYVGEVEELLFDSHSNKVRYLVVNLENNEFDVDPRRVLIPIGVAQLNAESDTVLIAGITINQLITLPDYEKGRVNPGVENLVRYAFMGRSSGSISQSLTGNPGLGDSDDFYNHPHFNDEHFYKNRSSNTELQSVVGYFDDGMEAESAISQLISSGIKQESIDLSSGNLGQDAPEIPVDDPGLGLTHFMNNTVNTGNDNISETPNSVRSSVITVSSLSIEDARRVADILDQCGAVEVTELARV
jgi:sporulation protein YlmC with PRC-barrel domain